MKGGHGPNPVPEFQALATLDQAAPVNGTYYEVLATTRDCEILALGVEVATTGETLQAKITIDGNAVETTAFAAGADTPYWLIVSIDAGTGVFGWYFSGTNPITATGGSYPILRGRSIKIELKKTTAAGAGNLKASCMYAKYS